MCRLAYCHTSVSDFALDQGKLTTVLAGIEFTAPQCFETQGLPKNQGVHCFLTRHPGRNFAVLAFRGTDKGDPSDLTDDLEFRLEHWQPGGRVHTGFATGLEQVKAQLDQVRPAIDCRLLITGHSLGAAIATLLASAWVAAVPAGPAPPLALYTFGSPRVGDAAFVATLANVPNSRYVDCSDGVTRVPLEVMGYQHVGDTQYIDRDGKISTNPGKDFIHADRFEAMEEYFLKYFAKAGNVGARILADHAPINYVSAVMGVRA
jgi:hypothetical protein